MSEVSFLPISHGLSGEHIVQAQQYIPGEEIYIYGTTVNATATIYTVPTGKRLLISRLSAIYGGADGGRYLSIHKPDGTIIMFSCYMFVISGVVQVNNFESFNPMIEIPAGYMLKCTSVGVAVLTYSNCHGYLINAWE